MTSTVTINDVGPRDGLQNQEKILDPADRVRLVRALLEAGVRDVEVAAFVSPRAVPAMAGAAEVVGALADVDDAHLAVLIPNMKGYELAKEVDTRGRAIVLTTTREHAELKRDQIHSFGKDDLIAGCSGSMSCTIEPVE